jgi:hypothetical protein
MSLPFEGALNWRAKTLQADQIWAQVKAILEAQGLSLPQTPRRPDVRMILKNVSGLDQVFRNPGDHSSKAECVPCNGDKTAAMVMVKGATLREQFENANALSARYNLEQEGLSPSFVQALHSGEALDLVAEAYGPAPFEGQAGKLVDVEWPVVDGTVETIRPVSGPVCAYGARAATKETVFLTELVIFVQGTTTTGECLENAGMFIAVAEDYKTKAETTRPIVPSVAKGFYGGHYDKIPVVFIDPNGLVRRIDPKNGPAINFMPAYELERPAAGMA